MSKILESAMKEQISSYVFRQKIIPEIQSGFREQHSTTTALLNVTDDILRATDERKITCLLLLDYSKAFDMLEHDLLCKKLRSFGFDVTSVSFIKSYLSQRTHRVLMNSNVSDALPLKFGVPQGSILGPLLFSLYISDFHQFLNKCSIHHYADDTQIYYSFKYQDYIAAEDVINSDLKRLHSVSLAHNLNLNPSKSAAIYFGFNRVRDAAEQNMNILLNGERIPTVKEYKNLGLWIDSNLRFTKHVNYLTQYSYSVLKKLYSQRHILDRKIKLQICEALIVSKISYADCIYGPALTFRDSKRIQLLQNACLRFSTGLRKFDHVSEKYREVGWLKSDKLRYLHMASLTHKILITTTPPYLFKKLIRLDTNNANTRKRDVLRIPRHSSAIFRRSFSFSCSKIYNELQPSFRNFSLRNFKKKLKGLLLLA